MLDLRELTIAQYHDALLDGKLTVEELVRFYLDRIDRYDGKIKSIISINPNAIEEAKICDELIRQHSGKTELLREQIALNIPLLGVPVLVKDNIETEELPTTAGSLSLKDFSTGKDAEIVKRLKKAGAIILAKTNLHEFAIWGETISSIKGQTLNPWDLSRTPGGSSGGTGAALAANFGLVGLGSDTINSIRSPSSANHLFGIRPTVGLVSDDGIVPYSLTQDTAGPMARDLDDAERVLSVISGKTFAKPEPNKRWRIGILRSFYGSEPINEPVNKVMQEVYENWLQLQNNRGAVQLLELEDKIDSAQLVSEVSVHLYELKAHLNAYLESVNAPYPSIQAILESGLHHPGIKENLELANRLDINSDEYKERMKKREALQNQLKAIFERENLDAIIFPHQQQLVCKAGESQKQRNGALAAISGFPSILIPEISEETSAEAPLGVPVGFELFGLPNSENKLLAIASLYRNNFSLAISPQEEKWL
ncbi:MAG: amidase [Anaerolineaceae bacterium]|nr:amidase [Anaerolineaceae bacterium]